MVASLTDSLLLPSLNRTDTRSAGQQTSAVPVMCTSRSRWPWLWGLISGPRSFSFTVNWRLGAGGTTAKSRLWLSITLGGGIRHELPAAMAIGERPDGICRLLGRETLQRFKNYSSYLHLPGKYLIKKCTLCFILRMFLVVIHHVSRWIVIMSLLSREMAAKSLKPKVLYNVGEKKERIALILTCT